MSLIEAQRELNKFLQGPKGARLKEYKDKKLSGYLMMQDGLYTGDELEAIIAELQKEYFAVLQEASYLAQEVEKAYHRSKEEKPPDVPLIVKLLDLDHPENPHRQTM